MTTVGITGHSYISDATAGLVYAEIHDRLARPASSGLIGVTCLARALSMPMAHLWAAYTQAD